MSDAASAQYLRKSFFGSTQTGSSFGTGTLIDVDLVRGNDVGEIVRGATTTGLFDGFFRFVPTGPRLSDIVRVFDDGEILATVQFSDGTTLHGVQGLMDRFTGPYGSGEDFYLVDRAALGAAGKTFADVNDISFEAFTDHDLSWADLGFAGAPVAPPPPPPPAPAPTVIRGTTGGDRLVGTSADELFIGNGGNTDRITGGGGTDTFVFGAQAGNGVRDRTIITDFDPFADILLITGSAQVARITENNKGQVVVHLAGGDGDRIILEGIADSGPQVRILFDADFML